MNLLAFRQVAQSLLAAIVPLAVFVALFGFESDLAVAKKGGNGGGGSGNTGGGFVQVSVEFADDVDPDDRIMSDGGGAYVSDKREKTEAVIDGNFNLDTGRTRKVFFDYTEWIPELGGDPDLTLPPGNYGADFRTHEEYLEINGVWIPNGPLDLLAMEPTETAYVGLTNGPRLNFYPDAPVADCSLSDPVEVTRSADGNSWTIQSLPDGKACVYKIVDGNWNDPQYAGYYSMPFQMTITRN